MQDFVLRRMLGSGYGRLSPSKLSDISLTVPLTGQIPGDCDCSSIWYSTTMAVDTLTVLCGCPSRNLTSFARCAAVLGYIPSSVSTEPFSLVFSDPLHDKK